MKMVQHQGKKIACTPIENRSARYFRPMGKSKFTLIAVLLGCTCISGILIVGCESSDKEIPPYFIAELPDGGTLYEDNPAYQNKEAEKRENDDRYISCEYNRFYHPSGRITVYRNRLGKTYLNWVRPGWPDHNFGEREPGEDISIMVPKKLANKFWETIESTNPLQLNNYGEGNTTSTFDREYIVQINDRINRFKLFGSYSPQPSYDRLNNAIRAIGDYALQREDARIKKEKAKGQAAEK